MDISSIDYLTDHKNFILQQFKNAENLNKIFEIKGIHKNELQALLFQILNTFNLESATGEQLDFLGKIVVFERQGRSDNNYRTLIKLKIKINISSGQPSILIQTIKELFNATFVEYKQIEGESKIINILQDGTINLVDEFDAVTEAGDYLEFDTFDDFDLITEAGDNLATEDLDLLEVYSEGGGDQAIFTIPDDVDESILYDIIPSGVTLYFLNYAVTEAGEELLTEAGDYLLF